MDGTRDLAIDYRPIEALIPYARNARTHSEAQVALIAGSIREYGFTNPVLVDGENGIIAGHGRVMAARQLGLAQVPVIELAHLSEAQKRAYILADNQLTLNGGWDTDTLKVEIEALNLDGFNVDLIGFSADELGRLMFNADFAPGSLDEQGKLDERAPKIVNCPSCGESFDARLQEA